MMFRQYDAIEASKDSSDDNEQGEENTTNSEENTETIVQDLNNTTETAIQANTEQETQQSDENQPTIDPQETENRTPVFYTKFRFSKGVLSSGHHSSTDNGSAAVYDNNDGTFTLDVRDNKRALNDSRFFSNAKEVDLTRPYEVVEKPILKKNKKGKLVIYKQGRLVNTDTLEYQAAQQEEQQISQSNEGQNTKTNGEQTITQGANNVTEQNTETNTQPVEGNTKSINDNVADNLSTGVWLKKILKLLQLLHKNDKNLLQKLQRLYMMMLSLTKQLQKMKFVCLVLVDFNENLKQIMM